MHLAPANTPIPVYDPPITDEWLLSIGFRKKPHYPLCLDLVGHPLIRWFGVIEIEGFQVPAIRTQQDLIELIRALKINIDEHRQQHKE